MDTHRPRLIDLIDDPICHLLMRSDGVKARDVLKLMRSVRPRLAEGDLPRSN